MLCKGIKVFLQIFETVFGTMFATHCTFSQLQRRCVTLSGLLFKFLISGWWFPYARYNDRSWGVYHIPLRWSSVIVGTRFSHAEIRNFRKFSFFLSCSWFYVLMHIILGVFMITPSRALHLVWQMADRCLLFELCFRLRLSGCSCENVTFIVSKLWITFLIDRLLASACIRKRC
jgi:hypothetical protein